MKTEAEVINEALTWLADEKNLYLFRYNEHEGSPPNQKKVQGWGFAPGAGRRPSGVEGSTVLEAIQSRLKEIQESANVAQRKIRTEADKHQKSKETAMGFLKNLEQKK